MHNKYADNSEKSHIVKNLRNLRMHLRESIWNQDEEEKKSSPRFP